MQKILIVIDMQNDFVTGPLGSEAAQVAAKNIAAHINEYDTVIFTRDTHGPDYLDTLENMLSLTLQLNGLMSVALGPIANIGTLKAMMLS